MSKILRMSDRIKIKIGKTIFTIAPLNHFQKMEYSDCFKVGAGAATNAEHLMAQTVLIKYGLKDVEGVKDSNGDEYKLEFNGDCLSDDCISEIFTLDCKDIYISAHTVCLNSYPGRYIEYEDSNGEKQKIKGVQLELISKKANSG